MRVLLTGLIIFGLLKVFFLNGIVFSCSIVSFILKKLQKLFNLLEASQIQYQKPFFFKNFNHGLSAC